MGRLVDIDAVIALVQAQAAKDRKNGFGSHACALENLVSTLEAIGDKPICKSLDEEIEKFWADNGPMTHAEYDRMAKCARHFYKLGVSKEELKKIVQEYVDKGDRCMDQSEDDAEAYAWWDGFHNCAQGILRELEDGEGSKD